MSDLPIAKVGLSVVAGDKNPTSQLNGYEGEAIALDEVATPAQADALVATLNRQTLSTQFYWDEWVPGPASNQQLIWAGDARILRLQPNNQSIGQLLDVQAKASKDDLIGKPNGYWDVNDPNNVRWHDRGLDPKTPIDVPGQPNAPWGPTLSQLKANPIEQRIIDTLDAIKADTAAILAKLP